MKKLMLVLATVLALTSASVATVTSGSSAAFAEPRGLQRPELLSHFRKPSAPLAVASDGWPFMAYGQP